MICGQFFIRVTNLAHLARAHHNLINCFVHVFACDIGMIHTNGVQCSLVQKVFKVRPRKARCAARNIHQIDIRRQFNTVRIKVQNLFAAVRIGQFNIYLAVKATGAQQRRVQHINTVRRPKDDYTRIICETIHFNQQLI